MSVSRGAWIGIGFGLVGALVGVGTCVAIMLSVLRPAPPKAPLPVRLDAQGPYLIVASHRAAQDYTGAIEQAKDLHPDASLLEFDPNDLAGTRERMRQDATRYALVFIEPDELDVNFAWRWLTMATELDDDPFVDVRTGFITGDTPAAAEAFVKRIAAAVHGQVQLPGKLIDNLGPNTQAGKQDFYQTRGDFMLPAFGGRLASETISHGSEAFPEARLASMDGAGVIHFGGHGHPDRVDDGLTGAQAGRLKLAPCVAFNGACYTGVTSRWFEQYTTDGTVAEHTVAPEECFCLKLLSNQVLAYLAALHPDHGIPVYQEMEYLASSGASLGDVMKHTHDGVVLGAGGKLPRFEPFTAGSPPPQWAPSDVMLQGTAARVLFGDPALVVGEACTNPPFKVSATEQDGALRVSAALANPELKSAYTDTYHADLAWDPNGFNDRALITIDVPAGWQQVGQVEVVSVQAAGQSLKYRLLAFGVEQDGDAKRLHVQVDLPTEGYMQSPFRAHGATVELLVRPDSSPSSRTR